MKQIITASKITGILLLRMFEQIIVLTTNFMSYGTERSTESIASKIES
jgi:hypothetical protein